MTNLEFYKDELKEKVFRTGDIHLAKCIGNGFLKFAEEHLNEINFNGDPSKFVDWLLEEYKEPIKLTLHEKCILESLPNDYKYIARDENGDLCIYKHEPLKYQGVWILQAGHNGLRILELFNHLFKFIKWEDNVAYKVEDILNNSEVVENVD